MTIQLNKDLEWNYLAIDLLDRLGNKNPTQQQIDIMENLLHDVAAKKQLTFNRRLTKREIACLFWAARGHTTEETAKRLHIKPNTVATHRKQLKKKLSSNSMAQAVFKGIHYGFITQPKTR